MVYQITKSRLKIPSDRATKGYIAGLIDGEGNFCNRTTGKNRIAPVIRISLQEKDKRVLEIIHRNIGGNLVYVKRQTSWKSYWKPQWKWSITSIIECREFTEWILPCLIIKHEDAEEFLRSLK